MDSKIEFNELCRLCLAKNHVGIPIFEGEGHDEVFLKISTCLPVNISYEDKLPKRICTNCLNKLNILYKFCNKSANSEKQLLDWFNQYGTANETSIDSNADYETAQSDSEIEIKEEALSFLTDEDDNIKIEDTDMENYNILQDIPKQGNDISNEQCSDTIGFNAVTNGTEVEVKQENDDDDDGKPKTTNLQPEVNTKYAKNDLISSPETSLVTLATKFKLTETLTKAQTKVKNVEQSPNIEVNNVSNMPLPRKNSLPNAIYKRKPDYCYYCKTEVLNFSRHVIRNHITEIAVAEILSKPLKSKERRQLLDRLRRKGNFLASSNKCFKAVRQTYVKGRSLLPCDNCMGFFSSKFLYRHRKQCLNGRSKKGSAKISRPGNTS